MFKVFLKCFFFFNCYQSAWMSASKNKIEKCVALNEIELFDTFLMFNGYILMREILNLIWKKEVLILTFN